MEQTDQDMTLREVAKLCGVRLHQAKYAVAEYDIQPSRRVGIIRLFAVEQIPQIQSAIRRIQQRREAVFSA